MEGKLFKFKYLNNRR